MSAIVHYLPDATDSQLSAMTQMVDNVFRNQSAEEEVRLGVAEELYTLVKPVIQDAFIELFGSSRMNCALKSSDVNLNVNIEDTEISNV